MPLVVAWVIVRVVVGQPVFRQVPPSPLSADPENLKRHVRAISENFYPRDYRNTANLDRCADYLRREFEKTGARVRIQSYEAGGRTYQNVIARFGKSDDSLLVVGAHYDACHDTPGADDNASGVAGLLELANLLGRHPIGRNIELVAYTLEEPPFFRTPEMGSAVHARDLRSRGAAVRGVIILEMIGYFSDAWMSQNYPAQIFRLFYPSRGNFIALAGRIDQRRFTRELKSPMNGSTPLPVWSINAPASLPGLDFSDHLNYWEQGYEAIMITDTAFYRNAEYHERGDTWDRLDYGRMGSVVVAVYEGLKGLR